MKALQAEGKTHGQIAKELGTHQLNVHRVLKPKKPEQTAAQTV
jgi:hypothetical protein